jgi:hypothetical protein
MKKLIIFLFLLIFSISNIYSQEEQSLKGQLFLSPDFGLMFGTINLIELSPALGYCITDRLSAAAGLKYMFYSKTRVYSNQAAEKTNIYGPRAFARYILVKNLGEFLPVGLNTNVFADVEFESNSLERKYFDYPTFPDKGRFWYDAFLIGGGFSQAASERINISFVMLWNTNPGYISLYNNPVIRFGIQFFFRPARQEPF